MQTVIGAFDDKDTAERAVVRLHEAGFDRRNVHLEKQDGTTTPATTRATEEDRGGWSFFRHLFGGDEDRTGYGATYDEAIRRGHYVVVVDAQNDDEVERAASLLNGLGAFNIDQRAEQWRASGWTAPTASGAMAGMPAGSRPGVVAGTAAPAGTKTATTAGTTAGTTTARGTNLAPGQEGVANVVQEEIQVGKRVLDRGGVRVIERVSEKPVHEIVRLREEHATVSRQKVDRPATEADLANFREGTIEVHESTEEPVVAKRARVVEEVHVGKEVRERQQAVDDTVRRKDVEVQRVEGREERAVAGGTTGTERGTTTDRTIGGTPAERPAVPPKDRPPR